MELLTYLYPRGRSTSFISFFFQSCLLKSKHLKCKSLTCSIMLCTCHLLLFTPLLILVDTNSHVWPYNTCVSRNNTLRTRITSGTRHQLTWQYSFYLKASVCHCLWGRSYKHSLNMWLDRHHTQYRWYPHGSSEADHLYLVLMS